MIPAPERRSFLARHRATFLIALVVSLVSSGTVAAVSYLVLGSTNTAGATTTLKSGVNGAVLQLTNTNATGGTSARGLGITVPAGRPPMTVNSASKVTNLNADKLDGLDSTKFARGSHVKVLANRILATTSDDVQPVVLRLPGLGTLIGHCAAFPDTYAILEFKNTTSAPVRAFYDRDASGAGRFAVVTLSPGASTNVSYWYAPNDYGSGLSLEVGAGIGAANQSASVEVRAYRPSSGSGCEFQATAILWTAN